MFEDDDNKRKPQDDRAYEGVHTEKISLQTPLSSVDDVMNNCREAEIEKFMAENREYLAPHMSPRSVERRVRREVSEFVDFRTKEFDAEVRSNENENKKNAAACLGA